MPEGSFCDFAQVAFDINLPLRNQIPANADVVHFNFSPQELNINKPYVITEHFLILHLEELDVNSILFPKIMLKGMTQNAMFTMVSIGLLMERWIGL